MQEKKKRIFSGIQPSGYFTLGNYLGALKNWVTLQNDYDCIFCVVDLHALTVRQEPKHLRKRTYDSFVQLLACGIDPQKALLFIQSYVSAHTELAWILDCYTYMGELNRMTQFKDKAEKHSDNINAGLFTYPSLMAADILLYQTDLVPVGDDQKQHIELTRDLANRFNNTYSPTFMVPEGYYPKTGARIMSLQEPEKKMSKSDENENGFIMLLEEPSMIMKKIKRAVTDSENEVRYDRENKAGISNLMEIYSSLTEKSFEEIENEFKGIGYGEFKIAVGEAVIKELDPIQKRFKELSSDKAYVEKLIQEGAQKAEALAYKTLRKVKKKIGLYQVK
ncbi:tryptophan--tRNA ligase [Garciella nitratireducens]|uniref:Tryptophan--tRNA ligase n=1 Tax=Garciella nitratireducens DSM 15102 TaxID=1121911 RepID=A0A1T4MVS6_9FIRM|nr:tryptophan--tRNA ligase [Garciella nitratireducens]SJZ70917.1 tryptophanyl-tRNA synthetase [Garciella nitratireducens DSM 15102]